MQSNDLQIKALRLLDAAAALTDELRRMHQIVAGVKRFVCALIVGRSIALLAYSPSIAAALP